jgi:hypothetical protein
MALKPVQLIHGRNFATMSTKEPIRKAIEQLSQADLEASMIHRLYESLPSAMHEAVQAALHVTPSSEREVRNGVKAPLDQSCLVVVYLQQK